MRRTLAVTIIMLFLSCAGSAWAQGVVDVLVLEGSKPGSRGLPVFGRIREVEEKKIWVIVSDGDNEGPISIPRERVLRIEYDIDGRRKELPVGDFAARYRFALWELSLGYEGEARVDLEAVVGKNGVPAEALLLLARLQEKTESLREALASYNAYLHTGPQDKQKLRETTDAIKRLQPLVDVLPVATTDNTPDNPPDDNQTPVTTPEPVRPKVDEGLETRSGEWSVVPWADPATISVETDAKTGNQFMAVNMTGEGKSSQRKTAIQLRVGRTKKAVIKSPKLIFYVYNPDKHSLPISVAFQTGRNMTYFESQTFRFNRKGWHTVSIDLNSTNFKSAATDWAFKTAIKDKDDLKGIIILINTRRQQTLYLDYIKFTQ